MDSTTFRPPVSRPGAFRRATRAAALLLGSALVVAAGLLPASCSEEPASAASAPAAVQRAADPRLDEARRALGRGRLDVARTLLEQIGPESGLEARLLAARVRLHEGDAVAALRAIEEARTRFPGDPRVHATAAELYAALGRIDSAKDELERGFAVGGDTPDLQRARGVVLISQPGGIAPGLAQLEGARERDPALPYLERPLSQARLLAGRQALAAGDLAGAVKDARGALELLPEDPEARELLADSLSMGGEYDAAIRLYEELLAEGRPVDSALALLLHRAALATLLGSDRETALACWMRARELGLPPDQMKSGVNMLREEADARIASGVQHFAAERFAEAELDFKEALRLDPGSIVARNHLGVVLFRLDDPRGAAIEWQEVLDLARERGVHLPEPVHLNLARAYRLAGETERVRDVLERYLTDEPQGEWAAETREMLEKLDEELSDAH